MVGVLRFLFFVVFVFVFDRNMFPSKFLVHVGEVWVAVGVTVTKPKQPPCHLRLLIYGLNPKGAYSEKNPRTPLHNTIYGSK